MQALCIVLPLMLSATVADIRNFSLDDYRCSRGAEFAGRVTTCRNGTFVVDDGTGRIMLRNHATPHAPRAGDFVRGHCYALISETSLNLLLCDRFEVTGHEAPPPPQDATIGDIVHGLRDLADVRVKGTVTDAFPDNIDQRNAYLRLSDGVDAVDVSVSPTIEPERLVGAEVTVTGFCNPDASGWRLAQGRCLERGALSDDFIVVRTPPPADPFAVPTLDADAPVTAQSFAALGRRRATGRVAAVWQGDRILVDTGPHHRWQFVQARLTEDQALPTCDQTVEVIGVPRTDRYSMLLANARWRPGADAAAPAEEPAPQSLSAAKLLTDAHGNDQVQVPFHGRLVRLCGTVLALPSDNTVSRLQLGCDGYVIPVDTSACPGALAGIEVGCTIEATGICLLQTESWQFDMRLPNVEGFALVARSPGDIRLLARPPWWTPGRFLAVILALVAALVGIAVWNRILQRLIERRGRQLFKSEIAKAEAELRVDERTRLAVEIHDSLAQTLTGVGFQIDAAAKTVRENPDAADGFLAVAKRTLLSCREELRRCLWDLRNHALEERDFSAAVRETVRPGVGSAELTVRFNVPRAHLSDRTAHAILCILRELSVNAVRHGRANRIRIAGEQREGVVRFSVTDDGAGFDPAAHPGPAQGHFGLQGVRERVAKLGGTVRVESAPGKGARIVVEIGK